MTYIEFFDKNATENICSCLSCVPDRVVFIGNNAKHMLRSIEHYRRIFETRGHNIEFTYRTTPRNDLENAMQLILELLAEYEDCVFDITGGDELLILALGLLREKYPEKNIQIHKFNLRNNTICDCDMDGNNVFREAPRLTAQEHIGIHGGGIHYGDVQDRNTYEWVLDEDFLWDLDIIWDICKEDVRMWNIQAGIFAAVERVGQVSEDGLTTRAFIPELEEFMSTGKIYYCHVEKVVAQLIREGMITDFAEEDGDFFRVRYKNLQVKRCLSKAGQALEMRIFVAAKLAQNKDGDPIYNDVLNGVVLDWDGNIRQTEDQERYDTENEIDVLLMHGVIPVFISCKNGLVTTEELYKLNTVAERFGGEYSKKVLVATALELQGASGNHLRQRAADMNIRLMEDVQDMDMDELTRRIALIWNN